MYSIAAPGGGIRGDTVNFGISSGRMNTISFSSSGRSCTDACSPVPSSGAGSTSAAVSKPQLLAIVGLSACRAFGRRLSEDFGQATTSPRVWGVPSISSSASLSGSSFACAYRSNKSAARQHNSKAAVAPIPASSPRAALRDQAQRRSAASAREREQAAHRAHPRQAPDAPSALARLDGERERDLLHRGWHWHPRTNYRLRSSCHRRESSQTTLRALAQGCSSVLQSPGCVRARRAGPQPRHRRPACIKSLKGGLSASSEPAVVDTCVNK